MTTKTKSELLWIGMSRNWSKDKRRFALQGGKFSSNPVNYCQKLLPQWKEGLEPLDLNLWFSVKSIFDLIILIQFKNLEATTYLINYSTRLKYQIYTLRWHISKFILNYCNTQDLCTLSVYLVLSTSLLWFDKRAVNQSWSIKKRILEFFRPLGFIFNALSFDDSQVFKGYDR